MKHYPLSVFILLLLTCGLFSYSLQGIPVSDSNRTTEKNKSEIFTYISDYFDLLNIAGSEASNAGIEIRLPSCRSANPFDEIISENFVELERKNQISDYLYISEYNVIRFEGPDIIYPFNYFW